MVNGMTVKYPGIPATTDGAGTVVHVETAITEGSCAYPITSSTTMGVGYGLAVSNGKKNLWGTPLVFLEPESEHSSASAAEGFAVAGGRVTNFTSGQGLILMKEVLYVISGKRLPVVFHIGARAMTSHSLNVHAGHDDIMGVSDVGWGVVFARNAQESGDLALISRKAAEASSTPFFSVQDGFLTTHTIENVLLIEEEFMKEYIGDPADHLRNLMDPYNPVMIGVVQNQDSYMKGKIAQRHFTDTVKPALMQAMEDFSEATGRNYGLIDGYQMDDAEVAIIGIGSMIETATTVVDGLRAQGRKAGCVHVTCFRPFPGPELVAAVAGCKSVAVLERMDDPMAQSNPLTTEFKAALADSMQGRRGYPILERMPCVHSGAYGLGSRDVTSGDLTAVYDLLESDSEPRYFTLGIDHSTALEVVEGLDGRPPNSFSMRGHSVGGFGSVTTNKIIATVSADLFGKTVQAYPKYGSEKKGLPTNFYLTIADERIRIHHELDILDFIAVQDVNAFSTGNPLKGLREGGTVFLQSTAENDAEVWSSLPPSSRKLIQDNRIRILWLDTAKIAKEVSSSVDLVVRMQGIILLGIFLRSTPFAAETSEEDLYNSIEKSLRKYFGKRGEQVVQDNLTCVKRGYTEVNIIDPEVSAEMEVSL
ncbi:MAG: 2-oxoacid:acceptor oxidoreductase family protein [Candidatus Poseidoniaceae archaeon]|jgi:pyruvate-ferredoxin/flavodoxin oxidoreductase|nr:2-oxoacid:acceptor oxidoreductase family protein [Candidatus Poseidoniaceae archaeon]